MSAASELEQRIAGMLDVDERVEYENMVDRACDRMQHVPLLALKLAAERAERDAWHDRIKGLLFAVIARREATNH